MSALLLPALYVFYFALFLLPGFAIASCFERRCKMQDWRAIIVITATSATAGYLAFWIYLANKIAGEVFSYGTIAAAALVLCTRRRELIRTLRAVTAPLLYMTMAGILYLSCLYLWVNPVRAGVDVANFRFFQDIRPGDNIIPFIFAERIYDRQPVRPFCCGGWLSSDRPPLQAGIFLMQRPLRLYGGAPLQYQLLGTALQCLWIAGVWDLLRALKIRDGVTRQILGLLVFASFCFYNSVYVWPKLLAATFVLLVYAVAAEATIENRGVGRFEAVLASLCLGLALVAHPGSLFSLPALALLVLARWRTIGARQWAMGLALIVLLLLPWTFYQRFYDPPGNRLLKMHLAGVMEPDGRTTVEAIRDAYEARDVSAIAYFKWTNLATLIGPEPLTFTRDRGRVAQRDYIWNALAVLNFGWLAALVHVLRRRAAFQYGWVMIAAAAINLFVWGLVLFGPGGTVTAHASYADILLLGIGLAGFSLKTPRWLKTGLFGLTIANTVFVWVLFRPGSLLLPSRVLAPSTIQWPMALFAVSTSALLAWHFGKSFWDKPEHFDLLCTAASD